MADIVEFRSKPKGGDSDDDMGALQFTLHVYEQGHYLVVPAEQMPPDFRDIWSRSLRTLWNEAQRVHQVTGELHDRIVLLAAIGANGRIVSFADDEMLDTLERNRWLKRMLRYLVDEQLPPFRVAYDNDNNPMEPTP